MDNLLAQFTIGSIRPPVPPWIYGSIISGEGGQGGLTLFATNIIRLIIVIGGLYAFFNFIFAGYAFLSAGGDPKKIVDAWGKIWQTIVGVIFMFVAFLIGAVISALFYGGPLVIFRLRLFGPY